MSKFRLGVIGCGKHARRSHIEVAEDFEVTALFDPSAQSIAAMRELVGDVSSYESEVKLLAQADVDAVLIASLDKCHARQLLLAVQAGKHVLCEKPIAISPEDIDLMEKALTLAEANGLVVASCHPRRSKIGDLPYGWVSANLPSLIRQCGPLERVWLSSIYPKPSRGWKEGRSFLLDKYVHDIDALLRWLPQGGEYEAERMMDSHDHYEVKGKLGGVGIECVGTRLHCANDDFIEVILLGFARGKKGRSQCVVYTKTGLIRYYDGESDRRWEEHITPMESEGYDRVFAELMRRFAESLRGGQGTHTLDELRVINGSAVALAGPAGSYRSA